MDARPPRPGLLLGALGLAVRGWPLAAALYLPGLLVVLALAAPTMRAATAFESVGLAQRLAEDGLAEVVMEVGAAALSRQTLASSAPALPPSALAAAGLALLAVPLGAIAQWLAYAFLSGGVLARLSGAEEPFWTACRHWFWPMLRYSLLVAPLFGVLALVGVLPAALVPGDLVEQAPLRLALAAAWLTCANGLFEVGRADMLVCRDRRALRALGRAFALVAHRGLVARALLVWLLLGMASAALLALEGAALAAVPVLAVALWLVVQQLLALAGAWLKLLRLAAAVEVARALNGPCEHPSPGA